MSRIVRFLSKSFKVVLLTLLFGPVLLVFFFSFFTVTIPQFIVKYACDKAGTEDFLVSAGRATIRLTEGLRVYDLRVMDTHKLTTSPMASARRVDVALDFFTYPFEVKGVNIKGLSYPRLPDEYYLDKPYIECDEPLDLDLPQMDPFPVHITDAHILGLNMRSVDIASVLVSPSFARAEDVRVTWPDADVSMAVMGDATLDLRDQQFKASLNGQARQHNVRPLLKVLDIDESIKYMDSFTGILTPIDVNCRMDINLRNNDFHMNLGLHPTGGAYREVPLKDVHGALDVYTYVRGTNLNVRVKVGPLSAALAEGGDVSGSLLVDFTNGLCKVFFDSVKGSTSIPNAFKIAEYLDPSMLSFLSCDKPPEVSLEGVVAADLEHISENDISGKCSFAKGSVFGIPLLDASADWTVKGDNVSVSAVRASAMHGGTIAGGASFNFPMYCTSNGVFNIDLQLGNVSLADLAEAFKFDLGDRHGFVDATIMASGSTGNDFMKRLNAKGSFKCRHGHLAQLNLFSGFTTYLVEHVPGVASVVNQSQGGCSFVVENGVFKTENLFIEGDVFSIQGSGSYDMVKDNLDFVVKVNLFRNDTLLSRLATPISWTFNKLLLEFTITGPLDRPVWTNSSVLGGLGGKGW